jgi:hypothetical protein
MFRTPHPKGKHFDAMSAGLKRLLDDCTSDDPKERPANFDRVLAELNAVAPQVSSRKSTVSLDSSTDKSANLGSTFDKATGWLKKRLRGAEKPEHPPLATPALKNAPISKSVDAKLNAPKPADTKVEAPKAADTKVEVEVMATPAVFATRRPPKPPDPPQEEPPEVEAVEDEVMEALPVEPSPAPDADSMIPVSCPKCAREYKLKSELAGRSARCASCRHEFRVPTVVGRK